MAGALLVVTGAACALSAAGAGLSWEETVGVAIVAAGATLVAGSFFGASPWLVAGPLAVAACAGALAAADVSFDGPIGERAYRPATAGDLPDRYDVAIGSLHVDLRDLHLAPGTTTPVKVRVGIGEVHVDVPDDVAVRIDAHVGGGELRLPGGRAEGSDVDREETLAAPGRPVVELDVSAGLGEVRVERSAG